MMTRPVLIMAGGTGGHVFPALAVADELKTQGVPIVWLGTKKGIEAKLVADAGYEIRWLSISGLRGKNKLSLLLAPFKLLLACIQALNVIIKVKPVAVLGMGGFVSGPGGLMAFLTRKSLLVHEQNAIPGMTNSLLSKMAGDVIESFPGSFQIKKQVHLIGNPVRNTIMKIESPAQRLKDRSEKINVLVVGGSLGAAVLNKTIPEMKSLLKDEIEIDLWHQTGVRNYDEAKGIYKQFNVEARVDAFIDDMAEAYSWADIVICRSGAMTISELAMAGVASILVPYPYAVDDHQTANANYLVDKEAAILMPQDNLTAENLKQVVVSLTREKILKMSEAAKQCAQPDAAKKVAQLCMQAGGLA